MHVSLKTVKFKHSDKDHSSYWSTGVVNIQVSPNAVTVLKRIHFFLQSLKIEYIFLWNSSWKLSWGEVPRYGAWPLGSHPSAFAPYKDTLFSIVIRAYQTWFNSSGISWFLCPQQPYTCLWEQETYTFVCVCVWVCRFRWHSQQTHTHTHTHVHSCVLAHMWGPPAVFRSLVSSAIKAPFCKITISNFEEPYITASVIESDFVHIII